MTSTIGTVTFDVASPSRMQDFWAAVLGYSKTECADDWALIKDPGGGGLAIFFQRVPESKSAKNRVHLDVEHDDPEAEAERLIALGATKVKPFETWVVMHDIEGNEFCIVKRSG